MGFNELFTKNLLVKHRVDWVNCRRLIVKHGVVLDQDTSRIKPDSPLEGEHAEMITSACPSVVQWDPDKKTFVQNTDELSRPLPCIKMEIKWPTKKRKIIRSVFTYRDSLGTSSFASPNRVVGLLKSSEAASAVLPPSAIKINNQKMCWC